MFGRTYDLTCKACGIVMAGINNYELREKCEACGGNKTKYHKDRPNPEKPREKK